MPHKMRAVFLDGREETMETGDFVDGAKAFSGLVPLAVSYSIDYGDVEHGIYCRIGVHDAGKTVEVRGHAASTPRFSPAYDVQLLDSAQVGELYEFWWDGACKLRRLGGRLVNLTRLAPTADQSVGAYVADAAAGACEVLAALFEKEGVSDLDDGRIPSISAKVGWEWEVLRPFYEAYAAPPDDEEDDAEAEDDTEADGEPPVDAVPPEGGRSFWPQPDGDDEDDEKYEG